MTLKAKGQKLDVTVQVGKEGLTETVLAEMKKQLNSRRMIKVKFARGYFEGKDKKAEARKIAGALGVLLVDQIGFTAVYAKTH